MLTKHLISGNIVNQLRSGKRLAPFETVRIRKDGSEINISLTISPIYNLEDEIIGASFISKDISKRIEIEEQSRVSIPS